MLLCLIIRENRIDPLIQSAFSFLLSNSHDQFFYTNIAKKIEKTIHGSLSLATRIESNRNGGWVDIQVVQEGLNGQTNMVELDNIKRKKNEVLRQGVVVGLGRQSRHTDLTMLIVMPWPLRSPTLLRWLALNKRERCERGSEDWGLNERGFFFFFWLKITLKAKLFC